MRALPLPKWNSCSYVSWMLCSGTLSCLTASSETRGQLVGARKSQNGQGKKVKNANKSPWGQGFNRPVPNGPAGSGFWLVPENLCFFSAQLQSSKTRSCFAFSYTIHTSRPVARHMFILEEKSSSHSTKCRGDRSAYLQVHWTFRRYGNISVFDRLSGFVHSPMSINFSAFRNIFTAFLGKMYFFPIFLTTLAMTETFPVQSNFSSQWQARYVKLSQFFFEWDINWLRIVEQGSYGSWRTWKVLEFYCGIFQDWKVLEIC